MTSLESPDIRIDLPASGDRSGTNPDRMDADDQLQGVPEWLEDFAENLKEPEILVPAQISQEDSDSERPTKVVENQN